MMSDPAGKAAALRTIQTKLFVRSILAHEDRERISARLPPDIALKDFTDGFNFGWVPLSTHDAICGAVEDELGEEAHIEVWRAVFSQSMQQPFLRGFIGLLQRFSNASVLTLARRCHRVYEHLTRACGSMRWEEDSDKSGRLCSDGFPAEFSAGRWARSSLGCMQAGVVVTGHSGDVVRIEHLDEQRGEIVFTVDL